jgi:type III secretory pathway component EscS
MPAAFHAVVPEHVPLELWPLGGTTDQTTETIPEGSDAVPAILIEGLPTVYVAAVVGCVIAIAGMLLYVMTRVADDVLPASLVAVTVIVLIPGRSAI